MKRKKAARGTTKKKRKAMPKTRARAKRAKKKLPKPRRRTQPASKAVLSGGIYAGDPTGGHIGDRPPAQ